jgi:protocatechuate 3,4-dioxygenase beta subunit/beta-lactamase regulating signal transducer with metallopeptidase domain
MSDLSIQWLIVFVDASVKAALVALVAAAGLSLLRVRDSNLRHRAWMGVLCGMLLLPVLTQVIPTLRLPFSVDPEWFAELQRTGGSQALGTDRSQTSDKSHSDDQPAAETTSTTSEPVSDGQPAPLESESPLNGYDRALAGRPDWPGARGRWPGEFHSGPPQSYGTSDDALTENPSAEPAAVAETKPVEPEAAESSAIAAAVEPSVWKSLMARIPLVFWSVWILGAALLTLRLLAGLWMAQKLRRASRLIDPARLPALVTNANTFAPSRRDVPILECPTIRVPFTLGVFHPRILLPPDWVDWSVEKLHVVLIHERTHAERGDCALALLAELNRCLYWFHPLAWWLRRRLASLAEAACDDAAIGTTGDRASYARHLLEVAATARAHRGRLVIGGVSMARCSSVETRIDSILDFRRPLSQRLTRGTALVLVAVIVPLIALAAALRPSTGPVEESLPVAPAVDEKLPPAAEESPTHAPSEKPNPENSSLGTEYSVLSAQLPASDVPFTFAGTVVGSDGQPVAGAKVAMSYFRIDPSAPNTIPTVLTDNRGEFKFAAKKSDFSDAGGFWGWGWVDAGLVATKEGLGFAYGLAAHFEVTGRFEAEIPEIRRHLLEQDAGKKTNILTMPADDVPIRGRLVNTEGLPIAGASVEAINILEGEAGTLDLWEGAANEQTADYQSAWKHLRRLVHGFPNGGFVGWQRSGEPLRMTRWLSSGQIAPGLRPLIVPGVRTDADGRFTLRGIGRDRIADVLFRAPGMETTLQFIRTRLGGMIELRTQKQYPQFNVGVRVYASDVNLVVGPSVPVEGRVADFKTRQPVAGVQLQSMTGFFTRAVTDAQGTYRLEGLPLGKSPLIVRPPPGSRHLPGGVSVTTAAGSRVAIQNVTLTAGTIVRGRAIDETTGKPVQGSVEYFAYETNPHLEGTDSLRQTFLRDYSLCDSDGRFEIAALPGKGILGVRAGPEFPTGVGAERIDCPREQGSGNSIFFITAPSRCAASGLNLVVPLDPLPDDSEFTVDAALSSGASIPGVVFSPDGQPLSDYVINGARRHVSFDKNTGESFTIRGYFPNESRRLIVYHAAQNLAGFYDLTGKPPEKVEITLRPAATLMGRVLDPEGDPLKLDEIKSFEPVPDGVPGNFPAGDRGYGKLMEYTRTDAQGRFQLNGIIPGLKYTARVWVPTKFGDKMMPKLVPLFTDVVVESAETKDLGDLRPTADKPAEKPPLDSTVNGGKEQASAENGGKTDSPAANTGKADIRATGNGNVKSSLSTEYSVLSTQSSRTVHGRVVDAAGKPVAGVALSVPVTTGIRFDQHQWKLESRSTTDAEGGFSVDVSESDFPMGLRTLPLLALHSDYAVEWLDVPEQGEIPQAEIVLYPEQVIQGRMIDTEGRPVAGAKVAVRSLGAPKEGNSLDAILVQRKNQPAIWMAARKLSAGVLPNSFGATSDDQGRFVLRGIAAERVCEIDISAPRFATTAMLVANRRGLDAAEYNQPGPRRVAGMFLNRPQLVGAEFTHVGAPDLTIEGHATTTDGKPVANLDVFATMLGSPFPPAVTDADGRYRLSGLPRGRQFGVTFAFGGHGDLLPQMVRVLPKADEALKTVDVELKRGIFVNGRVVDGLTGAGVSGNISFVPLPGNANAEKPGNDLASNGGLSGYADKEGNFRFAVNPGPGVLLVLATPKLDSEGRRHSSYPQATVSEEDAPHIKPQAQGPGRPSYFLSASGQATMFEQANAVKYVNFAAEGEPQTVNFKLDRGRTLDLEFVDAGGQAVAGVAVLGISSPQAQRPGAAIQVKESRTTVFALVAGQPRKIIALHEARGLAGTVTLNGDEAALVRLTLEKSASIRGRAVDETGIPIADAEFSINFDSPAMAPLQRFLNSDKGGPATDKDGQFRIANLVPGEGFYLTMRLEGRFLIAKLTKEQQTLKPGQNLDLGDMVFVPRFRQLPQQNESEKSSEPNPPLDPPVDGGKEQASAENGGKKDSPAANTGKADIRATGNGNVKSSLSTEYSVLSTQSSRTVRGRVVDAAGKPLADVSLQVLKFGPNRVIAAEEADGPLLAQTKTDADGRFALELDEGRRMPLIAVYPGFALDLFDIPQQGDVPAMEIVLKPEQPIPGRMIDAEGRPVAGAKVFIGARLSPRQPNLLDEYLEERKKGSPGPPVENRFLTLRFMPTSYLPISDAEGRFVIHGIAADGACQIQINDARFVRERVVVVNRQGLDTAPYNPPAAGNRQAPVRLVGPDFTHVGIPGLTIEGRATANGKPAADLIVRASANLSVVGVTTTDAEGRYRLTGVPRGGEVRMSFGGPERQTEVLRHEVTISTTADDAQKTVDVELKLGSVGEGTLLSGRVIDPLTGKGVPAFVRFVPILGNEFANQPRYKDALRGARQVRANGGGEFRVPVIPGPGAVMVQVNPTIRIGGHMVSPFRMGVVSKADSAKLKLTERPFGKAFPAAGGGFSSLDLSNIAQYVDLAEGAQAEPIEITLDRGKTAELEIVDGDGQPVTGAVIVGIDDFSFPTRLDESRTTLYALAAESPRKLIVRHSLHGLAGLLTVTGNEPSPIRMMLDKAAAIRGRAVDKSGAPIAETACETFSQATFQLQKFENTGKPQQKTGADGRFRFDNLIPGEPIELRVSVDGKLLTAKLTAEQQPQKPGQEVDLGDVVFAPPNQQLPQPNKQNMAAATPPPLSAENSVLSTQSPAADIPKSSAKSDGTFTFAGSVVDEQGQPVARAKVSVSYFHKNPSAPDALPALLTDERGKFEFSAKNGDFVDGADGGQGFWFDAGLVAVKAGYGFAFRPLVHFETSGRPASELPDRQRDRLAIPPGKKSNVLTLVRDDIPIRGRILNADGQPVAGATIEAFEFWEGKDGTLDAWDAASKKPDADTSTTTPHLRQIARGHTVNFNFRGGMGSAPARRATMHGNVFAGSRPPLIPVVHTGEDGRFTLHGIGRERIAELLISGPGIETSEERVRTRAGETVKLGLDSPVPHASLAFTYHPHEFTLVSGPSIPVTGRVTDFKTGQPLAGVGVESSGQWKGVVTDADGKYRLEGLPVGVNDLLITPPARSRHLPGGVHLTTTAAAPTVVRDISLTAGVLVRGRAIDETTGKPVRGNLQYFAYKTNPHATESDSLHEGHSQNGIHPDADGRFEIPVLPGQGILALRAGTEFPDGVGADGIDCPRQATGGNSIVFETWPTYCIASAHSLLAPINPRPEDNESTVNLALRSTGSEFQARVFAPDGQPLINYLVFGARRGVVWQRNTRESFNVTAYNPSETRRLIVFHQERNLVGYRDLSGEPPKDLAITLQPAATLVGRVLDADDGNAPFPQVSISDSRYTVFLRGQPSAADLEHGVLQINLKTDSDGRFELKGIVPGLKYSAYLNFRPGFFTERRLKGSRQGPVFSDVTAEPGQTKNLGDLVLKLDSGKPAESVKPTTNEKPPLDPPVDGGKKVTSSVDTGKPNSSSPSTGRAGVGAAPIAGGETITFRGRVLDPDGKPFPGAKLRLEYPRGVNPGPPGPAFDTSSDSDGQFRFSIPKSEFDTSSRDEPWKYVRIAAVADGFGFDEVHLTAGHEEDVELQLAKDVPIHGRILDLEGTPVAGATIRVRSVSWNPGEKLDTYMQSLRDGRSDFRFTRNCNESLVHGKYGASLQTDAEGRFRLTDVGAERLVALYVQGPTIEHSWIHVLTRETEPVVQGKNANGGRSRPDRAYGARFDHLAAPGRSIVGTVRDQATGKPLAGVAVRGFGSISTVKTDELGRFEIFGYAKSRQYNVQAIPQAGQHYFSTNVKVADTPGLGPIETVVELQTGILCHGVMTDKSTGQPVAGEVQYYPLHPNAHAKQYTERSLGKAWSSAAIQPDGQYEVPALPGPGVLAFAARHDKDSDYAPAYISPAEVGEFFNGKLARGPGDPEESLSVSVGGRSLSAIRQMSYHALALINPEEGTESLTRDVALETGKKVRGQLRGPDDKPLDGVAVFGLTRHYLSMATALESDEFEAIGLGARRPRLVQFLHREKKLGLILPIRADDTEPLIVHLQPLGAAFGRLLDKEGEPVQQAILQFSLEKLIGPGNWQTKTDVGGRFRVEDLISGQKYRLSMQQENGVFSSVASVSVAPGETKDLGDVRPRTQDKPNAKKPEAAPPITGKKAPVAPATTRPEKPDPGASVATPPLDPPVSGGKTNATEGAKSTAVTSRTVRGRVVDAAGKPIAGVALAVPVMTDKQLQLQNEWKLNPKATSDAEGRFAAEILESDFPAWREISLIAQHRDYGVEWFNISNQGEIPQAEIVLYPEQVIRGRMIDAEARPVSRAKIAIRSLLAPETGNSLDAILAERQKQTFGGRTGARHAAGGLPDSFGAVSDDEGRFVLHGVAAERLCQIEISAADFTTTTVLVANRQGLDAAPYNQPRRDAFGGRAPDLLVGPDFTHVGAPGLTIEGRVTAAGGKPVADLTVGAAPMGTMFTRTATDAEGRYRLSGLPRGRQLSVAFAMGGHGDLLPSTVRISPNGDEGLKTVDAELKNGLVVSGRIVDPLTGGGVRGAVTFIPLPGNEYVRKPGYEGFITGGVIGYADDEGHFRFAAMPGPGVLTVEANSRIESGAVFRRGTISDEDVPHIKPQDNQFGGRFFVTAFGQMGLARFNLAKYVNFAEDDRPQTVELKLDRGKSVELEFVDAANQPVAGLAVLGISEELGGRVTRVKDPRATIYALGADQPRKVVVLHAERGLAGSVTLTGDEASPVRLTLGKSASIRGVAVDESGDPISGAEFGLQVLQEFQRFLNTGKPGPATDKDGRFRITNLVPGEPFRLVLRLDGKPLNAKLTKEQQTLKPGQDLDLGDVVFVPQGRQLPPQPDVPDKPAAKPPLSTEYSVPSTQSSRASSAVESTIMVRGRVTGPDGNPAVKANVAIIGSRIQPERGGDLSSRSHVLAEVTTDEGGRFEIKLADVSSKAYSRAHVIARSEGSGLAWRRLDPDAHDVDVALELPAEQVIRARFIDIEGQPAGGVRVSIGSVISRSLTEARSEPAESVGYQKLEKPPQAWPPLVTADPQGAFEIRGIPADHGVYLDVEGTDRIAPQWISINTGFSEERSTNDGTYRSLVRNFKPGEEAVLPLAPAQIFEGVVRFEDTGEPAPHARLTIWASQQQFGGSMISLAGKADARGRYRINPLPGVRFGITAYPPDGVPYLIREIRDIRHRDGALVKQVDVSLPRGVLVRGRVVESGTKNPIAGVAVQYVPETRNNPNVSDDIVTGWQGIQLSGMDGAFEIAVLPGPGTLLANGPGKQFVSHEFGSRQLERGLPGGERNYAHAMQRINPKPNSDPLDLKLTLHRGVTISGRITNSADEPVEKALLISRLNIHSSELTWRGFPIEALGGRFELSGLGESREYPVHFLDPKNRLGATVVFKAGDQSPTVVLEPCGEAVATFADSLGKPIPDVQPDFEFVVAPGPHRFGSSAMRLVALAADAEYVVNIDRTNYREGPKSDAEGRITFPALIPGGRYRIVTHNDGKVIVRKEFVAESGKTLDLGKIIVAPQNDE